LIRGLLLAVSLTLVTGEARADRIYTVRRGDTLSRIARRFDVSVDSLRSANEMGRRSGIRDGEDIVIPDGSSTPAKRPRPNLRGRVGSVALALALLSNRPPTRIVRRAGPGPDVPASLKFPSPRVRVGRGFGSGRGGRHKALDIAAHMGDRIKAAHRGFIVFSGVLLGYGKTVMIVHPGGSVTLYGHLSRTDVRSGQNVARGRVIGRAGSTGNSTGPHLHFGLFVNGEPADPAPLLDPQPVFSRSVPHEPEEVSPQAAPQPGGEPQPVIEPDPEPGVPESPTDGIELSSAAP